MFGCLGEGVTQAFAGPGIRQVGAALGVMAQGLVGSGGDLAAYGVDAGHGAAQASGGYGVDRVLCEVRTYVVEGGLAVLVGHMAQHLPCS